MVTGEELVKMNIKDGQVVFKMATVTELFEDGTAKVKFYGEESASEKEYSYLASYHPASNDTVLMASFADTYIIMGKVLFEEVEAIASAITQSDLDTILAGYAISNHTHSGYAPSDHQHTAVYCRNGLTYYPNVYSAINYNGSYFFMYPYNGGGSTPFYLGNSTNKWSAVYATTGTINTSDRNQKKDISSLADDTRYYEFFKRLVSVKYRFIENESDRFHIGWIAQDVEQAIVDSGLTSLDFAGFIKSPVYKKKKDGTDSKKIDHYEYGLRYSEFIALQGMVIQKLMSEQETVNERLSAIERVMNID